MENTTTTTTTTKKVATKKVTPKRSILNRKIGAKPSKELQATVNVLTTEFVPQTVLFGAYIKELRSLGSNSNSNLETRFNRSIYRSIESSNTKESIQAVKFSIASNFTGIKIVSKKPIQFKSNGDAIISSVRDNEYKIKYTNVKKVANLRQELKASKNQEKKTLEFQKSIGNFKASKLA